MNESVYGTENSAMERYNCTHSTMFLIAYWDGYDHPEDMMITQTKDDALEIFMSLVEEELFEEFYGICQDRLEDINQDWEERAQWVNLYDSLWQVMEVPVIYGNTCC